MIHLPVDKVTDYKSKQSSATAKDVRHVDNSNRLQKLRRGSVNERRRRPDRRKKQVTLSMSDRRRVNDRRSPKLLNARSAKPEPLYCRKGSSIDTRA